MRRCALLLLALSGCMNPLYDGPKPDGGPPPLPTGGFIGSHVAPQIVLVVDRSGSMIDPASASGASCETSPGSGVYDNERTTNCKWNNLLTSLEGVNGTGGMLEAMEIAITAASGADAQLGLITFADPEHPSGSITSCTPGSVRVAVNTHTRAAIASTLDSIVPGAATPTAAAMALVPQAFATNTGHQPDRFAILLTDGMPNCDGSLTPSEQNCGGDHCTASCNPNDWANCPCNPANGGASASYLCLDDDALVSAVAALNTPQVAIRTFVVGFGMDTLTGIGAATLERVAQAGGTNAQGPALTETHYYQANSTQDLSDAMQSMLGKINATCRFALDSAVPDGVKVLHVVAGTDGASQETTAYTLSPGRADITLSDQNLCQSLRGVGQVRFVFSY